MKFNRLFEGVVLGALVLWLVSCASPGDYGSPVADAAPRSEYSSELQSPPAPNSAQRRERPGLGTAWGRSVSSEVYDTRFARSNPTKPNGVGKVYYNDKAGARAMTGRDAWDYGRQAIASGWMTVRLVDSRGRALKSSRGRDGSQVYVGERGDAYQIELTNTTASRLEVVVSVDGLDVVNGRPAGYGNRGYVIGAGEMMRVEGFRRSSSEVARFEFGKVKDSYLAKSTGGTASVGVIGVAVFAEKGTKPVAGAGSDLGRRKGADPFPGQRWAVPVRKSS